MCDTSVGDKSLFSVNRAGSAGLPFFFLLLFMSVGILHDVWLVLCFTKRVIECHLLLDIRFLFVA